MTKHDQLDNEQMDNQITTAVRNYWDAHIHDLEISPHPPGSEAFYQDLDEYRFDKLNYLPKLVDFNAYMGKRILEVGCGTGIDLVRFARGGASAFGVELSSTAIKLAQKNFEYNGLQPELYLMDGRRLGFSDNSFDMVYANGVLQYTPQPEIVVSELHRVLRPGGKAIFMMYNKYSWLNLMSRVLNQSLEHENAPVFRMMSQPDFKKLLQEYENVSIIAERFPVKTRLHQGLKARMYNQVFVPVFNLLPHFLIRPFGWHLIAFASKG